MKRIINESVQLLHIGPNTLLTPTQISRVLQRAQGDKMYAKFYTDKVFIQVNFARDGNISVSSNIKSQPFLRDYTKYSQEGWSMMNVKTLVYQWMQLSRRMLY